MAQQRWRGATTEHNAHTATRGLFHSPRFATPCLTRVSILKHWCKRGMRRVAWQPGAVCCCLAFSPSTAGNGALCARATALQRVLQPYLLLPTIAHLLSTTYLPCLPFAALQCSAVRRTPCLQPPAPPLFSSILSFPVLLPTTIYTPCYAATCIDATNFRRGVA